MRIDAAVSVQDSQFALVDPDMLREEIDAEEDPWSDRAIAVGIDVLVGVTLILAASCWRADTPVTVEVVAAEPPLAEGWSRIGEASVGARTDVLSLQALYTDDGAVEIRLPSPGWYRLRVCGRGEPDGEATDDAYLLQLWPAPFAPPQRIRG